LHAKSHETPLQVADELGTTGHGEHEDPHAEVLVFDTHEPPQRWNPTLQLAVMHALPTHAGVPFGEEHTVVHDPQWVTAFVVFASHPSEVIPLQFAKPAEHAPITHEPPTHDALAFAKAQARPHAPQLFTLAARSVSHTVPRLPSHSPRPAGHAISPHTPAAQLALAPPGQAMVQRAQFVGDVFRFVSQPFAVVPSQSPKGARQVDPHEVPLHVAVEFGGVGQGTHDDPHAFTSVFARQPAPHRWKPESQLKSHAAAEHVAVAFAGAEQGVHDDPHEFTSAFDTHAAPHRWKPALHEKSHTPPVQVRAPFAGAVHALLHEPQCAGSESKTHVPTQSASPAAQGMSTTSGASRASTTSWIPDASIAARSFVTSNARIAPASPEGSGVGTTLRSTQSP
jgi:hypothetical protein